MTVHARALACSTDVLANDALKSAHSLNALLIQVGDVRQLIVATAIRCLGCQKTFWDRERKELVHTDDGPTQMKAAAFLAAYTDGLPTNTTLALNVAASVSAKGEDDRPRKDALLSMAGGEMSVEDAMKQSPALCERVRAMLDSAERSRMKQAEKVG